MPSTTRRDEDAFKSFYEDVPSSPVGLFKGLPPPLPDNDALVGGPGDHLSVGGGGGGGGGGSNKKQALPPPQQSVPTQFDSDAPTSEKGQNEGPKKGKK